MPPGTGGGVAVRSLGRGWGRAHHENAGLLPIHEAFGNGVGSQDLVAGDTGQMPVIKHLSSVLLSLLLSWCTPLSSVLPSLHMAWLTPPPTPTPMCGPSKLTVGGTPGRRSCWGSPDGRCECLPAPRCSAAAPAPERRPACQTARAERPVDQGGWDSGSSKPQISGLGDPPCQATEVDRGTR